MQKDLSAVVRTRSLKQKREREEERETKRDLSRETSGVAGVMRACRTNTPNAAAAAPLHMNDGLNTGPGVRSLAPTHT